MSKPQLRPVVLICGSRGWNEREPIERELHTLDRNTLIVHGAARGADTLAGEIAMELGFEVMACPADWKRYGKAAGIVRNKQMLDEYRPQLVIAFVRSIANSPGSMHTINTARKMGIATRVHLPTQNPSSDTEGETEG